MSWQDILKEKKKLVVDVMEEIHNVLSEYKNVDPESSRQLLYTYRDHEIEDIYDNFSTDPDKENGRVGLTYEYMIQCNVYDKERKDKYTGVLFSTYLDDDTNEIDEFFEKVMKLSFYDDLDSAKDMANQLKWDYELRDGDLIHYIKEK